MASKTSQTKSQEELNREQEIERASARNVFRPLVDLVETSEAVLLEADLPGVDERSVDITLENRVLTVRGRVEPPQFEGMTPVHTEYGIGDYERSFTLSDEIDRDRIEAAVRNGVLRVTLPKSRQAHARRISVQAG